MKYVYFNYVENMLRNLFFNNNYRDKIKLIINNQKNENDLNFEFLCNNLEKVKQLQKYSSNINLLVYPMILFEMTKTIADVIYILETGDHNRNKLKDGVLISGNKKINSLKDLENIIIFFNKNSFLCNNSSIFLSEDFKDKRVRLKELCGNIDEKIFFEKENLMLDEFKISKLVFAYVISYICCYYYKYDIETWCNLINSKEKKNIIYLIQTVKDIACFELINYFNKKDNKIIKNNDFINYTEIVNELLD